NAFVSVSTGHFIAYLQLTLLGNIHLRLLDNSGRQVVANLDLILSPLGFRINLSSQISVVTKEQSDMSYQFIIGSPLDVFINPYRVELFEVRFTILLPFGNQLNAAEVVNPRRCFITKQAIQVIYHLRSEEHTS